MQKIKEVHNDVFYAPYSAFVELYRLRMRENRDTPFEDFVRLYTCINVDGKIYCNEDDKRFLIYQNATKSGKIGLREYSLLPDAIVMDGRVIKNRYGINTTFMTIMH